MARFEIDYEFEEVTLPEFGKGMYLDGTAKLADDDGDGQFYVSEIILDGHTLERQRHGGKPTFEGELFIKIAKVIYASDHAATTFAAAWNESRLPDPDQAYEEMRHRRMFEGA